jgi:hypothetical protein
MDLREGEVEVLNKLVVDAPRNCLAVHILLQRVQLGKDLLEGVVMVLRVVPTLCAENAGCPRREYLNILRVESVRVVVVKRWSWSIAVAKNNPEGNCESNRKNCDHSNNDPHFLLLSSLSLLIRS